MHTVPDGMSHMKQGILYVASGERYTDAAAVSAASVRKYMPHINITLAGDGFICEPFDQALTVHTDDPYRAKILALRNSPYEQTLMLDVDTQVVADPTDIFTLLSRFDIAVAHAPNRVTLAFQDIPDSFPEFNTGVVAMRQTQVVQRLLDSWLTEYDRLLVYDPPSKDQPSFRRVSYNQTGLRIATLTPEFNLRFTMAGFINQEVRILHGWAPPDTCERIGSILNLEAGNPRRRAVFSGGKLFDGGGNFVSNLTS